MLRALLALLTPVFLAFGAVAEADHIGAPVGAVLDGALERLEDGRMVSAEMSPETDEIVFYFGASWCPPCQAFLPDLKAAHTQWQREGRPTELVFVSADGSCEAMGDYIRRKRMPWMFIGCRKRDGLPQIKRLRGDALPGLVVVNREGAVVESSYDALGGSLHRETLARIQ